MKTASLEPVEQPLLIETPAVTARSRRKFERPFISVVIPAHNEERYLGATLDALQRQTYPWFEVVVVANACSDRTADVARDKCDRFFHLKDKALGRARNFGGQNAVGELLVFLDADTELEPNALERIAEEFTEGCAAGTVVGRPDTRILSHRGMYFLKNTLHRTKIHAGSSGVMICWKSGFDALGGFDEALQMRENSEFMRRLRKFGQYKFIGSTSATTSMRRYRKRGVVRMSWHWLKVWIVSKFTDLRNREYETIR